jgi:L-ascorbate metabolism protein UlaG (beta-lactamase superfamily)
MASGDLASGDITSRGLAIRARRLGAVLAALAALLLLPYLRPAPAQTPAAPAKPEMMEGCPGLVASDAPRVIPAALRVAAALNPDQVRITYEGHSTFLIESPQQVRIATDYNDYVRPPVVPDIVTMNHAHDTHYTDQPNPAIKYVLRGWGRSEREPARHDVTVKDVRVRNVPTNIRNWNGGTERNGNSIFVFEIANLCIAHLGHLHHTLDQQRLNDIGRIDAVMAAVDGNLTLDLDGMVEVLHSLKSPLIIPMHYFSSFTLNRFLNRMRQDFEVESSPTPTLVISKATLPTKPKVLVLPGY